MNLNRRLFRALLVSALACSIFPLAAQDAPETPAPPPAGESEPAPPAAEKAPETAATENKPGFWGDHFALYLEAGGGTATALQLDSSIQTSASRTTKNLLDMDMMLGAVAVGWKLPYDRGSFRLEFNGFSEDSSTFSGYGNLQAVSGTAPDSLDFNPVWWTVVSSGGNQQTTYNPPTWQDNDGNGEATEDEIVYSSTPLLSLQSAAPEDFQNRLQTWDMLFYRDFGGRAWSSRYSAGLRYLVYDGNVPATAWISTSLNTLGAGFTDGVSIPLLYLREESTGVGPTGSLELHWNLFKRRLTFFGQARFAFLMQTTDVDSGEFSTLVSDGSLGQPIILSAPARIQTSVSQAVWNIGGRIGASVRIVEGFHVELYYDRTAYHDTVILPYEIIVPGSPGQIPQGTSALFNTQNLDIKSVKLTAGFQF